VNEPERPIGTYLYGRCIYETMVLLAVPTRSRCPRELRAARRTPISQRHRLPPLPHPEL